MDDLRPRPAGRERRAVLALLSILLLSFLGGCATRHEVTPSRLPQDELAGLASWYGDPYHGRRTASGEVYDMDAMTAAHRTLPFNAHVRVQRTDTGRQVRVRINDRGPYVDGRVIDLSRGAARALGMERLGLAPVRLTVLEVPEDPRANWAIVVGGLTPEQANRLADRLKGDPRRPPRVVAGWNGDARYAQVWMRGYPREEDARLVANRLREEGYPAFIVRTRM